MDQIDIRNTPQVINFSYAEDIQLEVFFQFGKTPQMVQVCCQSIIVKDLIFRTLSLELEPEYGSVQYFNLKREQLVQQLHNIGMCSPGQQIENGNLSVRQKLKLQGEKLSLPLQQIEKRIAFFLQDFCMEDFKNTLIENLSSGNYQKLKCILALFNFPKLLILDSPTQGFDFNSAHNFFVLMQCFVEAGCSIIILGVRPSRLAYSASIFQYYLQNKCIIDGNLIQFLAQNQKGRQVLKVIPSSPKKIKDIQKVIRERCYLFCHWMEDTKLVSVIEKLDLIQFSYLIQELLNLKQHRDILYFECGYLQLDVIFKLEEEQAQIIDYDRLGSFYSLQ